MSRVLAFLALSIAIGCAKQQSGGSVVKFSDSDPKMNAAIEKARTSIATFTTALQFPKPSQSEFSVKMPLQDGDQVEHMWLLPVTYDGAKFHGVINNEPETVSHVKFGDRVSVAPNEISDWMFVENGKLVGGYTLRVMQDNLSAPERAKFDKNFPYTID